MRKFLYGVFMLVVPFSLVACGGSDEVVPDPDAYTYSANDSQQNGSVDPGEFTEDTAWTILNGISSTVMNPQSTEDDLRKYATDHFISDLIRNEGSNYKEAQEVFIERSEYWEFDVIEHESVVDITSQSDTATSYRDRTLTLYSFEKSPQPDKCSLEDSWVVENGAWKLDSTDTSDCEETTGMTGL